jgi:hypothetical protein
MATKQLNIFLSASIPNKSKDKDPKYAETADVIAIRDAVLALTSVLLTNKCRLIWGGHPSITRLVAQVLNYYGEEANKHVTLYQSRYFEQFFPLENEEVAHIIITEDKGNKHDSLLEMRNHMLGDNEFDAAFFIGGMDGVEDEFKLFRNIHPKVKVFPIASTGAAAKFLYEDNKEICDSRLETELTYTSLIKDLLNIKMKGI